MTASAPPIKPDAPQTAPIPDAGKAAVAPAVSKAAAAAAIKTATAAEIASAARREKARKLTRSVLLWVGLPTLLATIYFGFIARSEYESVATLVFTKTSEAERDATILREYALSRDMLSELDKTVSFSERYQRGGDFLSRLAPNAGSETRYAFFRRHVDAQYDSHSHVLTLKVRAFSGARAQQFARQVLTLGQSFVTRVRAQPPSFLVVAAPSSPDEATHPRRIYSILTVFFGALALFGVGSLLIAAVREHGRF